MIKIVAAINSVPFKRTAYIEGRRYNPAEYQAFKEELGWIARLEMNGRPPLTVPIKVTVKIRRRQKPENLGYGDADNHLKAVLDSLNGICYEDDRLVVKATIELERGDPKIEVEIEEEGRK